MKPIANSHLTGKWYQITRTFNRFEMNFVEIFLYISMNCKRCLEMLYVGVKEDRRKFLLNVSLDIITENEIQYIIFNTFFFRKKMRVMAFDDNDGFMVLSDFKLRSFSIYSRKSDVSFEELNRYLNTIDFSKFNINEMKLYTVDFDNWP